MRSYGATKCVRCFGRARCACASQVCGRWAAHDEVHCGSAFWAVWSRSECAWVWGPFGLAERLLRWGVIGRKSCARPSVEPSSPQARWSPCPACSRPRPPHPWPLARRAVSRQRVESACPSTSSRTWEQACACPGHPIAAAVSCALLCRCCEARLRLRSAATDQAKGCSCYRARRASTAMRAVVPMMVSMAAGLQRGCRRRWRSGSRRGIR